MSSEILQSLALCLISLPVSAQFHVSLYTVYCAVSCSAKPTTPSDLNHNYANKQKDAHKDPFWEKLIGKSNNITIADLADQLVNDPDMSEWRRFRLALIIIVDGVLIASQQVHRPTPRYVKMLEDIDSFLEFPWGRESFLHTVRCMKPPRFEKGKAVDNPVGMLIQKLKQETFRLTGFPLALQLLAFRAIPMLQSKIPAPAHVLTIMDLTEPNLPNHPSIDLNEVLLVESNPSGLWSDESSDDKITYMQQLINNNHRFSKAMWPGGDCSEPLYIVSPPPQQTVHKKHTVPRKRKEESLKPIKVSPKTKSTTQRRRITRLFGASTSNPPPDTMCMETKVTELEARVAAFEASTQRLKEKLKRKRRTSNHFVVKHRRWNSLKTPRNNDHPPTPTPNSPSRHSYEDAHTNDAHNNDAGVGSESSTLSQYQVHLSSRQNNDPTYLVNPIHQSPIHHSPVHQTPPTHSPIHQSTIHPPTRPHTPIHQTAVHPSPIHEPIPSHNIVTTNSDHGPPSTTVPSLQSTTITPFTPILTSLMSPPHQLQNNTLTALPTRLSTHTIPPLVLLTLPLTTGMPSTPLPSLLKRTLQPTHPQPTPLSPHEDVSRTTPLPWMTCPILTQPPFIKLPLHPRLLYFSLGTTAQPFHPPPPPQAPSLHDVNTAPHSTPQKPAKVIQGFSSHSSTTNAFIATATLKASTSMFQQASPPLLNVANNSDTGAYSLSDSSPSKQIQRVVDEVNAQTTEKAVCELSDSSPAKKLPPHSPSDSEKILAVALLNCRTLPHYLLITSPLAELWELFLSTLSSK
ncbi:hypothetical protein N665_0764s0003 [Sinapis alba]|nr:hypothetical protein N665_0764s0003 [Sinapis alba]